MHTQTKQLRKNPYEQSEPVTQAQKDKASVIGQILKNKTYMPNSGMRIRLENSLTRLSLSDLNDLLIVILSK